MAKVYIPKIAGLLTETNLVDSPSNSLLEAENVIIEQNGKIQARHGLNIDGNDRYENRYIAENSPANNNKFNTNLIKDFYVETSCKIGRKTTNGITANNVITVPNHNLAINDEVTFSSTGRLPWISYVVSGYTYTSGIQPGVPYYVHTVYDENCFSVRRFNFPSEESIDTNGPNEQYGNHTVKFYLKNGYTDTNSIDYNLKNNSSIKIEYLCNTETNNVFMNSFYNKSNIFFKLIEFKDSNNRIISGLFVKQNQNEYSSDLLDNVPGVNGNSNEYILTNYKGADKPVYRYYKINSDSSKIITQEKISFNTVNNIFLTKESIYVQNENGLCEANLDDLYRPSHNRFFQIRWPGFVKLQFRLKDNDLFGNWFKAGQKIGIRYVFYRETGYDNSQGIIYYSEPSQIQEIVNESYDCIPEILLDYKFILKEFNEFKKLNDFTIFNSSRKFGIIIYRTKQTSIYNITKNEDNTTSIEPSVLSSEYFACTDKIPFNTLISAELQNVDSDNYVTFLKLNDNNLYNPNSFKGEFNLNDELTCVPNTSSASGNILSGKYIFSTNKIRFNQSNFDTEDIVPAKYLVSDKTETNPEIINSNTLKADSYTTFGYYGNVTLPVIYSDLNPIQTYYTFSFINSQNYDEFINAITVIAQTNFLEFAQTGTSYLNQFLTSELIFGVDIWETDLDDISNLNNVPSKILGNSLVNSEISLLNKKYPFNQYTSLTDAGKRRNSVYSGTESSIYPRPSNNSQDYKNKTFTGMIIDIFSNGQVNSEYVLTINSSSYNHELKFSIPDTTYNTEFEPIWKTITVTLDNGVYTFEQLKTHLQTKFSQAFGANIIVLIDFSYKNTIKNTAVAKFTFTNISSIQVLEPSALSTTYNFIRFQKNQYTTNDEDWLLIFKLNKLLQIKSSKKYVIGFYTKNFRKRHPSGWSITSSLINTLNTSNVFTKNSYSPGLQELTINTVDGSDPVKTVTTNPNNLCNGVTNINLSATYIKINNQNYYANCAKITSSTTTNGFSLTTVGSGQNTIRVNTNADSNYLLELNFSGFGQQYKLEIRKTSIRLINVLTSQFSEVTWITSPTIADQSYYLDKINISKDFIGMCRIEPNYKYKLTALNNITDQSAVPVTLTSGSLLTQSLGSLWKDRYVIKSIKTDLIFNDSAINEFGQLYTSIDKTYNQVAPKADHIISFKDFYLYAGINEPLVANIYCISQPQVSQMKFTLKSTNNITLTNSDLLSTDKVVFNVKSLPFNLTTNEKLNGVLYLDSIIFPDKYVNITGLSSTSMQVVSDANVVKYNFNLASGVSSITSAEIEQYCELNGTVFEKPYLSLRLTSRTGKVDIVSIQLEPYYNRRGYYSKKTEINEDDKNYLQFDLALNEGNSFLTNTSSSKTVSIKRQGMGIGNVAGTNKGQSKPAGTISNNTTNTNLISSTSKIYWNKTESKIIVTNYDVFDISTFKSPGIVLIQFKTFLDFIDVGLFTYSVVKSVNNTIEFSGVSKKYSTYYSVAEPTPPHLTSGGTYETHIFTDAQIYFIEGSNVQSVELREYNNPKLTRVDIRKNTDQTLSIVEQYNRNNISNNFVNQPVFTASAHSKKNPDGIALFSTDSNHKFYGVNSNFEHVFTDDYSWQIINKFNQAFIGQGINAVCRKIVDAVSGGFTIEYPDGAKIEMLNGKYDISTGAPVITYPGKHIFTPDINSIKFTTIAEASESLYKPNLTYVSKRNLPEITTGNSDCSIGPNDSTFIGYAKSVNDLFIFKSDGIYRIADEGNIDSFGEIPKISINQISTNLICQAAGSIQEINDEIIFLSQHGFTSLRSGGVDFLNENIKKDILILLQSSPKDRIRSFVNEQKNLYYCTLVNEVDDSLKVKSGTYIFNTVTRQWTFSDLEILDGMTDNSGRNFVAYKQTSIQATGTFDKTSYYDYTTNDVNYFNSPKPYPINTIFNIPSYNFSYPLTKTNKYNNFYLISREKHTYNLSSNSIDQYDFITETQIARKYNAFPDNITNPTYNDLIWDNRTRFDNAIKDAQFKNLIWSENGFSFVTLLNGFNEMGISSTEPYNYLASQNRGTIFSNYLPKSNNINNVINSVPYERTDQTSGNFNFSIFDSFVQHFYNRDIYIRFNGNSRINNKIELFKVKLTNIENYIQPTNTTYNQQNCVCRMYINFEFLENIPSWWKDGSINGNGESSKLTGQPYALDAWLWSDSFAVWIDSFDILTGIPVKITFNPESNNSPDTNKLFQEYMIHTETVNKGASVAFKTDSRVNFSQDRIFKYSDNSTTRNVFRTFIPTSMARGRYLIRQLKHNIPLENLIITGQTIVMRDTNSTRIQKDKDID